MDGERDGFDVDDEAMAAYSKTVGGLAGDVRSVGTTTLSGVNALPDDAFSKIGSEVGLSGAFKTAAQGQLDAIGATATGIAALAKAVGDALTGYQHKDAQTASNVRQAGRPV